MIDFSETVKLSLTALKANKTRSFLTVLGIVIGVSSVILLVSIGSGVRNYVVDQLAQIGSNSVFVMPGELNFGDEREGSIPGAGAANPKFTERHYEQLKSRLTTAEALMPYIESSAKLSYQGNVHFTQLSGVNYQYPEVMNQVVARGSFFTENMEESARKVIVLGASAAEELFGEEDPIGKKITVADQKYRVLGVLEEKGAFGGIDMDDLGYAPWNVVMGQNDMEYIQSFWVSSFSQETVEETKAEIETILLESLNEEDFSVLDSKNILKVVSSVLGVLTAALVGIGSISLLVGGIGIMNIMLVSVTERTREIGLRKAVGATPRHIMVQFLAEAVVLSLFGGIIGIALGLLGAWVTSFFIAVDPSVWYVLISFGVSSLVGVVFGVAPAVKAAKLDPIRALRYE